MTNVKITQSSLAVRFTEERIRIGSEGGLDNTPVKLILISNPLLFRAIPLIAVILYNSNPTVILYNSHPTVISLNSFQAKSVHEQVLEWTQNERSNFQSITSVLSSFGSTLYTWVGNIFGLGELQGLQAFYFRGLFSC